jgi:cation diffusion facilitator CzcD-associated flavoprotein CzcO
VELHSVVKEPIAEITANSIKTANNEREVDDIIFATGYDGLTGSFTSIDVRSRSGVSIKEHWADGPKTYLGMQLSDFPNLFVITAPGGPSVLANVITTTEQSIDFLTNLIERADRGRMDGSRGRRGPGEPVPLRRRRELLVHRQQCARQEGRLHALRGRSRQIRVHP